MDSQQLLKLYFILTQIFLGGKAKINLHAVLKLTVFMPVSCLMRSRRHNVIECLDVYVRIITGNGMFKENIIKIYLGERITKEAVIIRIESNFSRFHWGMKCWENYIEFHTSVKRRKITFNT